MNSWWVLPLWKTAHYFAITALTGIVTVVDFRILGLAKGLPLRPLQRLMPWAGAAFVAAAATGVVLLRLNPPNSLGPPLNVAFAAKILFLALIGLNDLLY